MSVITTESSIKRVVVFQDRAQIHRIAKVEDVSPGEHTIIFEPPSGGGWESADRDTLQVATSAVQGAQVILRNIQFDTKFTTEDVRPERKKIEEALAELAPKLQHQQDEIRLATSAISNYQSLRTRLTGGGSGNKSKHESNFTYSPEQWKEFSQFISSGITRHREKQRTAEREYEELHKEQRHLEGKKAALGHGYELRKSREVAEVTITVVGSAKVSIEFLLSYVIIGPSWKASYDLRIDKKAKICNVSYNALVRQNSGEDWTDVRLELSTSKAHVGGKIPEFPSTWYLRQKVHHFDIEDQIQRQSRSSSRRNNQQQQQQMIQPNMMMNMMQQQMMPAPAAAMAASAAAGGGGGGESAPGGGFSAARSNSAQVNNSSSTCSSFEIGGLSTVKANGESQKVSVGVVDLSCHFRYSATPKLESTSYLKIRCVNTSEFNFVRGQTTIFADEQLLSKSEMDDVAPGEDFWLFLGQAGDSMKVTRKETKKKEEISGGMFGKAKTQEHFTYTFTVKNLEKTTEELVVWDQLPISGDARVEVHLLSPKPEDEAKNVKGHPFFKLNEVKFIEWFLNLSSMQEETFHFEFTVIHPKDEQVTL